jgi:hypothetical protein
MGRLSRSETGVHATVAEIAAAERINDSYAGRVLRLTLLAPDIVEAILDGRQSTDMTLGRLLRPFPLGVGRLTTHLVAERSYFSTNSRDRAGAGKVSNWSRRVRSLACFSARRVEWCGLQDGGRTREPSTTVC